MATANKITAAFSQSLEGLPESIVYFPKGKHTIQASRGGKPVELELEVNEAIAAAFQADLEKRLASNVRPFGGFDHSAGAASFIPKAFRWDDDRGLMLDLEWTEAGRQAIEGRNYSYFSPTFLERDGKPVGLAKHGEVGSLVNDPAFEEIPRIAANKPKYNPMDMLTQIGLLTEEEAASENALELATLAVSKLKKSAADVETMAANAEAARIQHDEALTAAKAALDAANEAVQAAKEEKADALVSQAIGAGRIAPKDATTAAFWRKSILENPQAAEVLNGLPVRIDGKTIVAGRVESAPSIREMSKSEFDKLSPAAKSTFSQEGGRIIG